MEDQKYESAAIADEALEDVSGGLLTNLKFTCPICKKNYDSTARIFYKNMEICKICKKKLEDQPVQI